MRLRTWLVGVVLVACDAFGEGVVTSGTDAGGDAGGADGGSAEIDGAIGDGGLDVSIGPAADAACEASMRCIDFEPLAQRGSPFGFDTATDGGLGILSAGVTGYALAATATDTTTARGEAKIPGLAAPGALRVRMKVRADERVANDATSTHFLVMTCGNGDNLTVKLMFDADVAIQIGTGESMTVGTYVLNQWIPLDVVVLFAPNFRIMSVKRLDTNEQGAVSHPKTCEPPVAVRVQSSLAGNNRLGSFTLSVDDIAIDWN